MTIVADCKFITDASISSGDNTLASPSNPFVSGDVGKSFVVAGAGATGAALVTTIASFTGAGEVEITTAASATVANATANFGTDNTSEINNAIAALTDGGELLLECGHYLVSSVDLTQNDSITFGGKAWGINAGQGTVLVPLATGCAMVDLTGTGGPKLKNIQIGTPKSALIPDMGVLVAQKSGTFTATLVDFDSVFCTGSFSVAPLYIYGVGNCKAQGSSFWNLIGTNKWAGIITRDNVNGVASLYQTIATGEQGVGDWVFTKCEFQDYKASGAETGNALRLRGAADLTFINCLLPSPSSSGNVLIETVGSTPNSNHRWETAQFYSEGTTPPAYNFEISGDYINPTFLNCNFTNSIAPFHGSGRLFSNNNGVSLPFTMPPGTGIGGNATAYAGIYGTSAGEFGVGRLLQSRMIVSNIYAQADANIVAGSHTLTIQKNGSDTPVAVTISGNTPVGGSTSGWAIFNPGDRISLKDVAAGATSARFTAAVSGIPF